MAKLTQQELERHLWGAADILRGTVDAGDYKQYIFGLLFYKRLCDVWEEEFEALLAETGDKAEAADPDEHRFDIPAEHRWETVRQQSTQIGQRLNNTLAAIEDANLRLRGVFGSVDFANQDRFSDALLEKLLTHFEKHRLRNADVPADMLGDAYLYLIKMFAEGAGKKGGEFYTPRQIVRLMIEILEPRPGMSVYDPTCGSAGMLLEAVQYLKDRGEDARSLSLYGQEKNFATWGIAEINLFLHDVDDAFIAKGDTILSPKRYDPHRLDAFMALPGAYKRIEEVCRLSGGNGFPIKHQGKSSGRYPFAKVSDMNRPGNEVLMRYAENYVDDADLRTLKAKTFPVGTTFFPKVGATLLTNKRRIAAVEMLVDNNVMGAVARGIDPWFLYYAFCTIDMADYVQPGAVPSVNQRTIGQIMIPVPSKSEQERFAQSLRDLDLAIEAQSDASGQLRQSKAMIAADLLPGHVRVPA